MPLRFKRKVKNSNLTISVLIPTYNEEKTIKKVINEVTKVTRKYKSEIIVINDGSTDSTSKIIKKVPDIKVINNVKNLGKGYSIRKGIKKAKGDVLIIQDADLEYNPQDISKLLKPFQDNSVKVVYGSRVLKNNPISHWTFNLGGRLITFITNLLFNSKITDEPTGYKLFRKSILKDINLNCRGFEFCPEVTAKIAKKGIKIYEVPISYNPRPVTEKKIKWYDGIAAIFYLIKYRFID